MIAGAGAMGAAARYICQYAGRTTCMDRHVSACTSRSVLHFWTAGREERRGREARNLRQEASAIHLLPPHAHRTDAQHTRTHQSHQQQNNNGNSPSWCSSSARCSCCCRSCQTWSQCGSCRRWCVLTLLLSTLLPFCASLLPFCVHALYCATHPLPLHNLSLGSHAITRTNANKQGAACSIGYSLIALALGASSDTRAGGSLWGRQAPPFEKAMGVCGAIGDMSVRLGLDDDQASASALFVLFVSKTALPPALAAAGLDQRRSVPTPSSKRIPTHHTPIGL